ncbi:MAG: extracellular solute-binding protein [Spirochaetaceae bacterium]|nr:extracellular solute-binding protein [Spirochaetaceae bacterium]
MSRRTRVLAAALVLCLAAGMAPLFGQSKPVEITWWNYPNFTTLDGELGKYEKELVAAFNKKYPNIKVNVEMISFNGGPEKVTVALTSNSGPDLIFDYPGRITEYARQGYMAKLDDMFKPADLKDLNPTILEACKLDGKIVQYPFNVANFMMAVNKTMFEEAGLANLLPLNKPDRLWTTDEFTKALKAIQAKRPDAVPVIVYAKSNQGDQGTRIMAINLFGGEYMNADMSSYMQNKGGTVEFMKWLQNGVKEGWIAKGGEAMTSGDAIDSFLQGKAAFTIIYSNVLRNTNKDKKTVKFEEAFLPWPTPAGQKPRLDSFIGTIGVFDNGNKDKIAASKLLVDFIVNDPVWGTKNLASTGGFSARLSAKSPYADPEATFASTMVKYTGRYYNTVKGFVKMRTLWFPELQRVMLGMATGQEAMDSFVTKANATLKE